MTPRAPAPSSNEENTSLIQQQAPGGPLQGMTPQQMQALSAFAPVLAALVGQQEPSPMDALMRQKVVAGLDLSNQMVASQIEVNKAILTNLLRGTLRLQP